MHQDCPIEFQPLYQQRAANASVAQAATGVAAAVLNFPNRIVQVGKLTCFFDLEGGAHGEKHFVTIKMGASSRLQGLKESEHGNFSACLDDSIGER
jgi:hypothetical protein